MSGNEKVSNISIDNLLDSTLDDLEDLPEFKAFPPGVHRCFATLSLKEVSNVSCVELSLKAAETVELADPTKDISVKEGDVASCLFKLDNEFGRGNLKRVGKPLAEALGTKTTRELLDQVKGIEVLVVTTLRKDKNDADRSYLNIKELQVV